MGYKPSTDKAKERFKAYLADKIDISETVYKLLEVVHRQHVIESRHARYKYDDEDMFKNVARRTQDPIEMTCKYIELIEDWESSKRMKYGFEQIHLGGQEKHIEMVTAYNEVIRDIGKVWKRHSHFLDDKEADKIIDKLKLTLKSKLAGMRAVGSYVTFNSDAFADLDLAAYDYFSAYLTISYGTFGAFFAEFLAIGGSELQRNPIYKFIQEKMALEYEAYPDVVRRFNSKRINDRVNTSPGIKKKADSLIENSRIIPRSYFRFLAENASCDSNALKAMRRRRS